MPKRSDYTVRLINRRYSVFYGTECYAKGFRTMEAAEAYINERLALSRRLRRC